MIAAAWSGAMRDPAFSPHFTASQTPIGCRQSPGADRATYVHPSSSPKSELVGYPSPPMSDDSSPIRHSHAQQRTVDGGEHPSAVGAAGARRQEGNVLEGHHPQDSYHPAGETRGPQNLPPHRLQLPPPRPLATPPRAEVQTGNINMSLHYPPVPTLPRLPGASPFGHMPMQNTNYHYGYHPHVHQPLAQLPQLHHQQQFPFFGGQVPIASSHGHHSLATIPSIPAHHLRNLKPARRTKAHVQSACFNCKKAHLSCDVKRPCTRCVSSGKQSTCYDVPHKKRGRPRIRDDRNAKNNDRRGSDETSTSQGSATDNASQSASTSRRSDSFIGRSQSMQSSFSNDQNLMQYQSPMTSPGALGVPRLSTHVGSSYDSSMISPTSPNRPVIFLSVDLVVLRTNYAFQEMLAAITDNMAGRRLEELVDTQDNLYSLRGQIRTEREMKDPVYLPSINPRGDHDAIAGVLDTDVDRYTQGFSERFHNWSFRNPMGGSRTNSMRCKIQLAKSTGYFVALVAYPNTGSNASMTQSFGVYNQNQGSQGMNMGGSQQQSQSQAQPQPSSAGLRNFSFMQPEQASPVTPTDQSNNMFWPSNSGSFSQQMQQPTQQNQQFGYGSSNRQDTGFVNPYHVGGMSSQTSLSSTYGNYSRRPSAISEPQQPTPLRESTRPSPIVPSTEGLQLPPLRGNLTPPLMSPGMGDFTGMHQGQPQHRGSGLGIETDESPESLKRRKLNIGEIVQ